MSITGTKRLYDYSRALSSGITIGEGRIKSILPNIYLENKVLSGDGLSLLYDGDYPNRFPQAYDSALNLIGESFGIDRGPNETDDAYRQKLKLSIIQSPTKSGIERSVDTVFSGLGLKVKSELTSSSSNFFDGVSNNFDDPFRGRLGSRSFRIEIEITPSLKSSYENYFDSLFSNSYYDVKKSGTYKIYFDPYGSSVESVSILLNNTQFPDRERLIYSNDFVNSGDHFDLGFLSNFQQLKVITSSNSYESYLVFNEELFDFYDNPDYNSLLVSFGVSFLREVFQSALSFGVIIERIIVRQAGSGG